jgi:hypothetical protein
MGHAISLPRQTLVGTGSASGMMGAVIERRRHPEFEELCEIAPVRDRPASPRTITVICGIYLTNVELRANPDEAILVDDLIINKDLPRYL